jgi:TolB protein
MRANRILIASAGIALLVGSAAIGDPANAAFPGANGRLVFQREVPAGDHTQTDIYTIASGGADLTRLTATPNRNEFGPTWNAAGTRIAFWRTRAPFGPGSVWTMNADGSHQMRLTRGVDSRDPVWNPAGNRLVFTRITGTNFDLYSIRASDGGGLRQLTAGRALDFEPAWSPNGARIAFTRGFERGDPGDIYVLDVRSGDLHRVVHSPAYDHQVNWAPGGRRLVFERDWDSRSSVFAVNADGSQLVRLTRGPFFDTGPAYSPDGRWIAFGSDRGNASLDDLWVMRADGSQLHRVRRMRFAQSFPDWQPRRPG